MVGVGRKPRPIEDRMWERVDRRGPDDCWNWLGCKVNGYGVIRPCKMEDGTEPGAIRVTRLMWKLTYGREPRGMMCHRCDNPACCNPAHLFEGDAAANAADMVAKGRHWAQGRTHCKRGHEYAAENIIRSKGRRICKTCTKAAKAAWSSKLVKS